MSEDKPKEKTIEEPKDTNEELKDTKTDTVDDNWALIKFEKKVLQDKVAELETLNADLTKRLDKLTKYIEQDTVMGLVADIAPRTNIPEAILVLKSVEELQQMKKILDDAKSTSFISGSG